MENDTPKHPGVSGVKEIILKMELVSELKILAIKQGKPVDDLLAEAVHDLFRKYDKEPAPGRPWQ